MANEDYQAIIDSYLAKARADAMSKQAGSGGILGWMNPSGTMTDADKGYELDANGNRTSGLHNDLASASEGIGALVGQILGSYYGGPMGGVGGARFGHLSGGNVGGDLADLLEWKGTGREKWADLGGLATGGISDIIGKL